MKKSLTSAILTGVAASTAFHVTASAQTLQQFSQQDFEQLMKSNPQLLEQVVNPDGSVNRLKLEEILRDQFDYKDNTQLPAHLNYTNMQNRLYSERSPLEIENDVRLQKRLAEERQKAYEIYKKRRNNTAQQ